MMKWIWGALLLIGLGLCMAGGRVETAMQAITEGAQSAVSLCAKMVGAYVLWLGLLRIAQDAGLVESLSKRLRGVMRALFPGVPPTHPAVGAMTLNLAANMLGMGNAATPFGLQAMRELETLNPHKGRSTNAMCMLLIVNASSIQLIPTTIISLRASFGAANPADITPATLVVTAVSALYAIVLGLMLQGRDA